MNQFKAIRIAALLHCALQFHVQGRMDKANPLRDLAVEETLEGLSLKQSSVVVKDLILMVLRGEIGVDAANLLSGTRALPDTSGEQLLALVGHIPTP